MRISDWSLDVCSSDLSRRQGVQVGEYRKLWWTLIAVLTVTFAILGISGVEVYRKAPPIPAQVVAASGEVLMTQGDIMAGQAAGQSTGGMQIGSNWGQGAYKGPARSADRAGEPTAELQAVMHSTEC